MERPFNRLWPGLHAFELELFVRAAAVGAVPVSIVDERAPSSPGDAPVSDLVQCTGEVAVREDDPMVRMIRVCRQVQRFVAAAHQDGVVAGFELVVEQGDEVSNVVLHGLGESSNGAQYKPIPAEARSCIEIANGFRPKDNANRRFTGF